MRALFLSMLVVVGFGTPVVAQPPNDSTRFSPEGLQLLRQISATYDLEGKRVPPGSFDTAVLIRLSESKTESIRAAATTAAQMIWLRDLEKTQNQEIRLAFEGQIAKWPSLLAKMAIQGGGDEDNASRDSTAKIVENMMGDKPQQAVNKAWAIVCLQNGAGNKTKEAVGLLAKAGKGTDTMPRDAIDVRVNSNQDLLGCITLINRTNRTLRHCVLVTRLEADKDRLLALAREEELFGQLALPAFGFSEETIKGSLTATRLRTEFYLQDKGVLLYIPELPPGGKVVAMLAHPKFYSISKGADVNFWCDDWFIEHLKADNWAEARKVVMAKSKPTGTPKGKVDKPNSTAEKTPVPTDGKDPFQAGTVWVDNLRTFTVLERNGDTFKARFQYVKQFDWEVTGMVKDGTIAWLAKDVKGKGGTPVDNTGILNGTKIDFTKSDGKKYSLQLKP